MSNDWRMAFMFDAHHGAFESMEGNLVRIASEVRQLAGDAHVRLGVADRHPDLFVEDKTGRGKIKGRSVDGAIEISVAASRRTELPEIARAVSKILVGIAEPASLEVMAGPYYPMVPVRDGGTFLSLAFRRDPATTSAQFQRWWHDQHAVVAIPVLGAGLLAYDQVHVEAAATQELASQLDIAPVAYDAYDNLTWVDRYGYLTSISDIEGMLRIFQDEIGRIDHRTCRHALMSEVGR